MRTVRYLGENISNQSLNAARMPMDGTHPGEPDGLSVLFPNVTFRREPPRRQRSWEHTRRTGR